MQKSSRANSSFSREEILALEDLLNKLVSGSHKLADIQNTHKEFALICYRNNPEIKAAYRKIVDMKAKLVYLCFSCERNPQKYTTGLCEQCHETAMAVE